MSEIMLEFLFTLPFGSAGAAQIDQMNEAIAAPSAEMPGVELCNHYYAPIREACVGAGLEEVEKMTIGSRWRGTMPQVMAAVMALPDWAQGFAWPVIDDEQPES
jgi:hypothetical protein